MKRIDTLIHPLLWDDARAVLQTLEVYRGSAYFMDVNPELELTVLVEDNLVESTILALETVGQKGEVIVSSVDAIVHFGEESAAAVPAPSPALAARAGTVPIQVATARA